MRKWEGAKVNKTGASRLDRAAEWIVDQFDSLIEWADRQQRWLHRFAARLLILAVAAVLALPLACSWLLTGCGGPDSSLVKIVIVREAPPPAADDTQTPEEIARDAMEALAGGGGAGGGG